jgi:hypothetical protein
MCAIANPLFEFRERDFRANIWRSASLRSSFRRLATRPAGELLIHGKVELNESAQKMDFFPGHFARGLSSVAIADGPVFGVHAASSCRALTLVVVLVGSVGSALESLMIVDAGPPVSRRRSGTSICHLLVRSTMGSQSRGF